MAKTIESRILAVLSAAPGSPGDDIGVDVATVQRETGLTTEQVVRFGRRMRLRHYGDRLIRYIGGVSSFSITIDEPEPPRQPRTPAPDWFAPPVGEVNREASHSWRTGSHTMLSRQICTGLRNGKFVLPPWQRGSVWNETQRVALMDSIMRGISIGAITLWAPDYSDTTMASGFVQCPIADHPTFVIDGKQRLTTIQMAALGDLDHWRWNGAEWTLGQGFLVPSQLVGKTEHHWGTMDWAHWMFGVGESDGRMMCKSLDTLENFSVTFMTINGDVDHMVEVYRRLATHGSPHSPVDLAHMDRWMENDRARQMPSKRARPTGSTEL